MYITSKLNCINVLFSDKPLRSLPPDLLAALRPIARAPVSRLEPKPSRSRSARQGRVASHDHTTLHDII